MRGFRAKNTFMQNAFLHTSENPMADRRFEYAMQFKERGDLEAAADLLAQVIELAPAWAPAYFHAAEVAMLQNHNLAAIDHFRHYLRLDGTDTLGATIKLNLLGALPTPPQLPAAYVETLFDQYADRFESALVERLHYTAPQQLAQALEHHLKPEQTQLRVLDLGCGTGLMAETIYTRSSWLAGVDLSANMVAEAEKKNLYNHLAVADLHEFLQQSLMQQQIYDVVVAADVFVYVGELNFAFHLASQLLSADGLFAFTLQRAVEEGDFILGEDHRYAHSKAYISQLAEQCGLSVLTLQTATARQDRGVDVPGWLVVLQKPALASHATLPQASAKRRRLPT